MDYCRVHCIARKYGRVDYILWSRCRFYRLVLTSTLFSNSFKIMQKGVHLFLRSIRWLFWDEDSVEHEQIHVASIEFVPSYRIIITKHQFVSLFLYLNISIFIYTPNGINWIFCRVLCINTLYLFGTLNPILPPATASLRAQTNWLGTGLQLLGVDKQENWLLTATSKFIQLASNFTDDSPGDPPTILYEWL